MTTKTEILKVKFIKGGEKVELQYRETGVKDSVVDRVCEWEPHIDFKKAMQNLVPHFVVLCDYMGVRSVFKKEGTVFEESNEQNRKSFYVAGFAISGKDEDEHGIVISGQKTNVYGRVVILNTPSTKLNDDQYERNRELRKVVSGIIDEAIMYLSGEKVAPDPQGSFQFPDDLDKIEGEGKVTKLLVAPPENTDDATAEVVDDKPGGKGKPKGKGKGKPADEKPKDEKPKQGEKSGPKSKPKRVRQTPDNPSGIQSDTGEGDSEN